jgi:hypothetical protein
MNKDWYYYFIRILYNIQYSLIVEQPVLLILLMKDNELPHSLQPIFTVELSSPRFGVSPSSCVNRGKENVNISQNKTACECENHRPIECRRGESNPHSV